MFVEEVDLVVLCNICHDWSSSLIDKERRVSVFLDLRGSNTEKRLKLDQKIEQFKDYINDINFDGEFDPSGTFFKF